jgi:hypothetical protein
MTTEYLTKDEIKAINLAGELAGLLLRIIGDGMTRTSDTTEAIEHIHVLQRMVMANAAARAYPGMFRLLGETISPE